MKKRRDAKPGWGTLIISVMLVFWINNGISQALSLLLVVAVLGGLFYAVYRFCGKHPRIAWLFILLGLTNS